MNRLSLKRKKISSNTCLYLKTLQKNCKQKHKNSRLTAAVDALDAHWVETEEIENCRILCFSVSKSVLICGVISDRLFKYT